MFKLKASLRPSAEDLLPGPHCGSPVSTPSDEILSQILGAPMRTAPLECNSM